MKKKRFAAGFLLTAGILAAVYFIVSALLYERFMPGTEVNGQNMSLISRSEAGRILSEENAASYQLAVKDIHGNTEILHGNDISLQSSYHTEDCGWQNPFLFPYYLVHPSRYTLKPSVSYDADQLAGYLREKYLKKTMTRPANAYLTDFVPGRGYQIVPEVEGDTLSQDQLQKVMDQAIRMQQTEADLYKAGCYETPGIRSDDPVLTAQAAKLNQSVSASVTYDFGQNRVVLNADTYFPWIVRNPDGTNSFDASRIREYVESLKKNTDTVNTERQFITHDGQPVVLKGPYGYALSERGEIRQLTEDLTAGRTVEREPVYLKKGADRNGPDYGTSYVEIDLAKQVVYLVENGSVTYTTDCVTGNISLSRSTPPGIYGITYKAKNVILKGDNYAAHVSYWMPFNRGIGLHDAPWRGKFGGSIYRSGGSHGCVNLPTDAAAFLYSKVEAGYPVICHL